MRDYGINCWITTEFLGVVLPTQKLKTNPFYGSDGSFFELLMLNRSVVGRGQSFCFHKIKLCCHTYSIFKFLCHYYWVNIVAEVLVIDFLFVKKLSQFVMRKSVGYNLFKNRKIWSIYYFIAMWWYISFG